MAWIFQCLFWVTLMSASAYNCNHNIEFPSYDYTYPNYYDDSPDKAKETVPNRRVDHLSYKQYPQGFDRSNEGSSFNVRLEDKVGSHNGPTRMNERSVPEYSDIQRVQEKERVRLEPRVDDSVARIENGSYKVVNYHPKPYPVVANRRVSGLSEESNSATRDGVVFPGPTSKPSQPYLPKIPEECLKTGICEDLPDYPEERVASIVQQIGNATDRFKVDELDTPEIAQRIGPPEETELCVYYEKIITPRAAPDKDGNWYYILNLKDKPLQGFRVEVCERDKSPCSKIVYFYSGYEATCKQKYMLRYMTALDGTGQMIERPFKLPSCCSCVVRQLE